MMLTTLWLLLAGLAGGILAGLLGIGGGIIYVVALPYVLKPAGLPADQIAAFTVANSIFGVAFASLTANILNVLNREFFIRESLWVGIPGAIISIVVMKTVVTRSWYSMTFFNILLIAFLIYMIIALFRHQNNSGNRIRPAHSTISMSMAGMSGGILAALTGLGGGAAVVPILSTQLHMPIKKARSISLAMIFITALALTVFNLIADPGAPPITYQSGYIYFPAAIPLTIGVVLGSPLGSRLASIWSPATIRTLFALFLLIVMAEKIWQLFHI